MRITALETAQLGPQSHMPGLLFVRVHTDAGLIGLGETFYLPDACREVIHRDIAPTLLGADARQIERHWRSFAQAYGRVTGLGAEMRALSAVDVALWDIAGQAAGMPLHQLLGGRCWDALPHYNTCAGPLYAAGDRPLRAGHGSSARAGTLDDLHAALHDPAGLVRSLLDDGITALKVWPFDQFAARYGGQRIAPEDLAAGIAIVAAIRDAAGPEVDIMIEGHGLWALAPAVEIAQALAPYRIRWIEDLVLATDPRLVAELRRRSPVPVCGSEYLNGRTAYREMLRAEALDVVMVDPTWAGGITESRKVAALADSFGLPVTFHDCTGPVTLMAGIQLAFNAPNAIYQETVRAFNRTFYGELVEGMPQIDGATIAPPTAPGLGMRLREQLFEDETVRREITRLGEETMTGIALVTGAASGIGRATALELAARGWEVVGLDRAAGEGVAVTVDVTDTEAVARAVAEVGRVDLLANVAGTGSTQNVVDTPPELWDAVFAVNVRGIFNTSRAVLPGMIERGGGVIVNAASIAGMVGLKNRAAYCASKGAVIALTKAMAIDHVGDGIRVNCVCPGTVDTPWVGRLIDAADDPVATRAALVARQPMGRLGRAEEVAKAIAYLASDDAAFVTGTELVIDGGLVAG